ncbi:MAG: hypothetical protein MJ080_03915 [Clostridia bacterium]|nr:hypothetical protein [Clostridia bacterium]
MRYFNKGLEMFEIMVCTFFGHRTAPDSIRPLLHNTLIDLIENKGVHTFYVGNQGGFDFLVKKELKELTAIYPHIKYSVVLAYMPEKRDEFDITDYSDTMYPDGLESVPRRFAIDKRNRMMIEWSDIVVTYVCYSGGGAAKFKEIAERQGKEVINLLI